MTRKLNVFVACEFSGVVRDAFIARGHNAVSCDLQPTRKPGPHIIGDCRKYIDGSYDLVIAHPPCTYLCNSGVRHLYHQSGRFRWPNKERFRLLDLAADFFRFFLSLPNVCVENPIPHSYAIARIKRGYSQIIHPYEYGHKEEKSTCLWLNGLPKLKPTLVVANEGNKLWRLGPSTDRSNIRSVTFQGIADAMAEQWGSVL